MSYDTKRQVCARRGFSLLELLIVMFVTVILIALLMPALAGIQAQTERLVSASNQRQIGMGLSMYFTDHASRLPKSQLLMHDRVQEMQALYVGSRDPFRPLDLDGNEIGFTGWDGLGHLYNERYIDVPDAFYCPSHHGDHPVERYRNAFDRPSRWIYGNYQYRGDFDPDTGRRFTLQRDSELVIVTDGLRTRRDLNHKVGFNSLHADGSVYWTFDASGKLFEKLPTEPMNVSEATARYREIWEIIDGTK